jgi:hypothetical protein
MGEARDPRRTRWLGIIAEAGAPLARVQVVPLSAPTAVTVVEAVPSPPPLAEATDGSR